MSPISKSRQRLARRLASRRGREREGLALVEGPSVILEALRSAVEMRWVLVGEEYGGTERGMATLAVCGERGVEVGVAPDSEVRELCSTEAPRAVVACVRPPPLQARSLERGRYLMARGVQMPGNLGTLIRSAWAFGLDGVVVGRGTVDPWNPKVVRGSAGGVFHVPLIGEPEGFWAGASREDAAGVRGRGGGPGASDGGGAGSGRTILCADASGEPVEAVAAEGNAGLGAGGGERRRRDLASAGGAGTCRGRARGPRGGLAERGGRRVDPDVCADGGGGGRGGRVSVGWWWLRGWLASW